MLTFLSPLWLYALAPVALLGIVALWQGRHHRMRISSTFLWRDLEGQASGARRRAMDPLWVLLFVAALLAAVAAAGPAWAPTVSAEKPPEVQAVVRRLPDAPTAELFLRVRGGAVDALEIRPVTGEAERRVADSGTLGAGTVLSIPARDEFDVALLSKGRVVASRRFRRVTQPAIAIYERGPVPPALRRVFDLQPNITPDDGPGTLRIMLINAAIPSASTRPGTVWPQRDALVVFAGNHVPRDLGITAETPESVVFHAAAALQPSAATPVTEGLDFPAKVSKIRHVAASAEWQTVLRAGDLPFLLVRRESDRNLTCVYLASNLRPDETNWPLDPSFVIVFTRLVETMRPAGASGDIQEWTVEAVKGIEAVASRPTGFAPWLAALAVVLIVVASAGLIRRASS